MKELVTRPQADLIFTALPLLGAAVGIGVGLARRRPAWTAAGLCALGVGVLWRVFNAIAERLGLDSVANLAANLALFALVGFVAGRLWRRFVPERPAP